MTLFGWDSSHYDGALTKAVMVRALSQGIVFFTHKIGEGMSNTDTTAKLALESARDAGIQVLGGYYFIHSGDMVAQATRCVSLSDQMVPWWRTFDGWFWQTDAETDTSGHLPSPAEVKLFSDSLADQTGRKVIVYASHGMYGDRLRDLGHPLWNANYPSNRLGPFKDLYPGDTYSGWDSYSGQVPVFAQYTSKATIATRTTCDANAFRGTFDELWQLVTGGSDMALTPDDIAKIAHAVWTTKNLPADNPTETPGTALLDSQNKSRDGLVQSTANGESLTQIKAVLAGMGSGTGIDEATLRAMIAEEVGKALNATNLTYTVVLNDKPA